LKKVSKVESCNSDSSNANNKRCGNCNYFLGSKCGLAVGIEPKYGEYICKDMSCKDAPANGGGKKDRKNGESWCIYDGYIGEGRDVVGSRHWRYSCIDGEVKVEGCDDYRNGICVESEVDVGKGEEFSTASCRINRWQECMGYNMEEGENWEEGMAGKCEENPDCFIQEVNVDKGFNFKYCVPKYPPGFDLTNEGGGKVAETICSQASQKCTVIYVKELSGWKCKVNCNCEKAIFTQKMNEFCTSLGDCGGYVNVKGEFTDDGYNVRNAPKLGRRKINEYIEYAQAVTGQKAEPGNISEILSMLGIPEDLGEAGEEVEDYTEATLAIGGVVGALGYAAAVGSWLSTGVGMGTAMGLVFKQGIVASSSAPVLAGMGSAFIGAAIGAVVGAIAADLLGIENEGALIVTIVGGIAGALVGLSHLGVIPGPIGPIAIVIAVIILIIVAILGIGETKEVIVTFTCKPWQPPVGGANCEKCAEGLKSCSKYRCWSLGTACKFLNEGTGNELCIGSGNNNQPPTISPWQEVLTPGYKYELTSEGFKIRTEDDQCIQEFTALNFGIKTDKASQCKYELKHTLNYEGMENFFGESNLYLYNHSSLITLPSVDSIAEQFNITREHVIENYGNFKMYVRCQDDWGNFNLNEYLIGICVSEGPDRTAPIIRKTLPENNAYVPYNVSEQDIIVYLNEPAECKWSRVDQSYENMENSMECETDLQDQTAFGWPCSTVLTNFSGGENSFYFRCKDQPWLQEDNESRNTNQESYIYTLFSSDSPLSIDYIKPSNEVISGTSLTSIEIEVKTSGGAEDGKARCEWGVNEGEYITEFLETNNKIHKQPLADRPAGTYNIYVRCEDVAGNIASSKTSFKIKVDDEPPQVIRVYNAGSLRIITNENSICSYSEETCRFSFENGTLMSGSEKVHDADWIEGLTYHIKCKDVWGRGPDGCSMVVRTYEVY